MSVDAGIDYGASLDDMDTTFAETTDTGEVLLQDCSRALTERRGVLFWDVTATDDISEYRNTAMDPARLAEVEARVSAALGDHELLIDVQVRATFDTATLTLTVVIDLTAADGVRLRLVVTDSPTGFEIQPVPQ